MREFGFRFVFNAYHQNHPTAEVLFQLRREVARILEQSEFGDIIEITNEHRFQNFYATPSIDFFDEDTDSLHISYFMPYPLIHGNLYELYSNQLPQLQEFAENMNMPLTFHTIWL